MSNIQLLIYLVNQRLATADGLFERTIAEHEEELSPLNEENERQRKLLDAVFNPQLRLHRADVQQLLVVKEEVPPDQQESSLDQEDPEPPHIKEEQEDPEPPHIKEEQEDPEPPHIKEEQEELCTTQEGEQLQGLEEADVKFSFTLVKSEDDEEEGQSSHLHQRQTEQMETEADEEDCEGPEPDRNSDPDRHPEPDTDEKTGDTDEPQSGLKCMKPVHVSVSICGAGKKLFRCSECGKTSRTDLKRHIRAHTGERPFSCSVCKKSFTRSSYLKLHMRIHTGEKPFSCSVCTDSFHFRSSLNSHMRIHTAERPFSCLVCDERFRNRSSLKLHMITHSRDNRAFVRIQNVNPTHKAPNAGQEILYLFPFFIQKPVVLI